MPGAERKVIRVTTEWLLSVQPDRYPREGYTACGHKRERDVHEEGEVRRKRDAEKAERRAQVNARLRAIVVAEGGAVRLDRLSELMGWHGRSTGSRVKAAGGVCELRPDPRAATDRRYKNGRVWLVGFVEVGRP